MKSTIQQCYVKLLVQIQEFRITVTLFQDVLYHMLLPQGKQDLPMTEENLTSFLLESVTNYEQHNFQQKNKDSSFYQNMNYMSDWRISCDKFYYRKLPLDKHLYTYVSL